MSFQEATGARRRARLVRTGVCAALATLLLAPAMRAAAAGPNDNAIYVAVPLDAASPAPDRIDEVIRDAHARGLRVYATVHPTLAARAGELPVSRAHIIYRHPEWLMVPRELAVELLDVDPRSPDYLGRLARWTRANASRADALHLSPLQPEAMDYIVNAVAGVVARYPVDGVHLEGLRFPAPDFDYSRLAIASFRRAARPALPEAERVRLDEVELIDPFGYAEELAQEWRRFRVTRLTALVTRIRTAVRAVRADALVTASIVPAAEEALDQHFQDWQTWIDNGFVDGLASAAAPQPAVASH